MISEVVRPVARVIASMPRGAVKKNLINMVSLPTIYCCHCFYSLPLASPNRLRDTG